MRKLVRSLLTIMGFRNVLVAQDGQEAFEVVKRECPDLIITDWIMDKMDGITLAREIRKNPLCPDPYIPIIMMTGFSSKLRVEKARDHGITEFLVKPFTVNDLYVRIKQIVEKPRQFVEAGPYFGPDRRRKDPSDYEGPTKRGEDEKIDDRTDKENENAAVLSQLAEKAKQDMDIEVDFVPSKKDK